MQTAQLSLWDMGGLFYRVESARKRPAYSCIYVGKYLQLYPENPTFHNPGSAMEKGVLGTSIIPYFTGQKKNKGKVTVRGKH